MSKRNKGRRRREWCLVPPEHELSSWWVVMMETRMELYGFRAAFTTGVKRPEARCVHPVKRNRRPKAPR